MGLTISVTSLVGA